ncbi:DUF4199 domain-containing protein [Salibacter halophilus]|uniref:DUF4199 domain-containing protein n=1 Tax=Salibacter halophilus TaxID=1803916 RepID=A0A6N6M997_9FLAO|nr:DUF4199 domain-containing protein [Salibacter halophilus]KAB1065282.1 DUF4199 domain-containing protein [Salibacter halophilus]
MKNTIDRDFVLKFGLLFGLVSISYSVLAYVLGVDYMVSFKNITFSVMIGVVVLFIAGFKLRKLNNNDFPFSQAFKNLMIIAILGVFLSVMFDLVLNKVIDPTLQQRVAEATIEKTMSTMQNFGVPEEELDKTYQQMRQSFEQNDGSQYSFMGVLSSFAFASVFWIIPVLIVSLVAKKTNDSPFEKNE